jgi:hypothetical protein
MFAVLGLICLFTGNIPFALLFFAVGMLGEEDDLQAERSRSDHSS